MKIKKFISFDTWGGPEKGPLVNVVLKANLP